MHAMGNVIDMDRFSGLRKIMPVTHLTFLCGALALAGFPLASGFWSKDAILGVTFEASHPGRPYPAAYLVLFTAGMVTAGLTAFYTFRAYFRTFFGELRVPAEAGHHAHESPASMTGPLILLAIAALFIGIIVEPWSHWFSGVLTKTPHLHPLHEHHLDLVLMTVSGLVALTGVAVAYGMYVREPGLPREFARRFRAAYDLSYHKFRVDELYNAVIVQPLTVIARLCRMVDAYVVDGLVDWIGQAPRLAGQVFQPMQNGLVQFYALAMMLGVVAILAALAFVFVANS
jgi:NADH-quinone oxidoreductase subunit L